MARNRLSQKVIWAEMARRLKRFHAGEDWRKIRLWGLFRWGTVAGELEKGTLITDMHKYNHTVWVRPSEEAYHKFIEPLLDIPLDELTRLAGWQLGG